MEQADAQISRSTKLDYQVDKPVFIPYEVKTPVFIDEQIRVPVGWDKVINELALEISKSILAQVEEMLKARFDKAIDNRIKEIEVPKIIIREEVQVIYKPFELQIPNMKVVDVTNAIIKDVHVNNAIIKNVPVINAIIEDVQVQNAVVEDVIVKNAIIQDVVVTKR